MTFYLQLQGKTGFLRGPDGTAELAAQLAPVRLDPPAAPETPPSPWLACAREAGLRILELDRPNGREALAKILTEVPLYRITLELLVDKILKEAHNDPARMKGVKAAFAPEDPPEAIADAMAERYAFAGVLNFPIIASRTDVELIELYLKLYGAAAADHADIQIHLAAMMGGYPDRMTQHCDGLLWRGQGWVRMDKLIYDAERVDSDPEITFESYVPRGRSAAEGMAVSDPEALLAAWIQAERVQRELCRDIDAILRLPDIRRLPRFVREDVFRILEREAMKQVFAEGIVKAFSDWPELRRARTLTDPIEANARGEVSPLIQQIMNQTLSADARYAGSAEAFALQAERRWSEASRLLEK
jgi:hypothetical protein